MRREVEAWKVRPRRGEQKRSSKVSGSAAGKVIRIPQPCESQQLVTDPGSRQIALLRRRYLPYAVTSSQSGGEHLATGPFTLSREFYFLVKTLKRVGLLHLHLLFLLSIEKFFPLAYINIHKVGGAD